MAPKKATTAAPKKASAGPAAHASYKDMIKEAIVNLKERNGSSRQSIKKYVQANNKLGTTTDAALSKHISQALASGEKSGEFARPKGPSGPVKLVKKGTAPAKTAKAPAAKKATMTTKKPAAAKKTATAKKPAATKTKTTANSAKPRKAAPKKPAAAPAVEDKKPVVLGKTKSGRVTKSAAPTPTVKKAAAKKAAPKKAAAKKTATPKKAATPKKEVAA